jgi:hypothetical protein
MSRRPGALLAIAALVLGLGAGPGSAHAQDRERARQLFEQAARARNEGRWEDVRSLLEASLFAYPQFSTAWNLVTAIERIGDLPGAENLLVRLRDGGVCELTGEEQESVAERLDEVARRLATLLVVAPDARGDAELDGTTRVELDEEGRARVRVNPGSHELVVVNEAGARIERAVEVAAGETLRVRLEPPRLSHLGGGGETDEPRPAWRSPWLWTGVGAAVAGGIALALALTLDRHPSPLPGDFEATDL